MNTLNFKNETFRLTKHNPPRLQILEENGGEPFWADAFKTFNFEVCLEALNLFNDRVKK